MPPFIINKPVQTDTATVEVTVSADSPLPVGAHVFQLVVVDSGGNSSAPVQTTVVVKDTTAPTAVIKAASPVSQGASFTLDGSASADLPPGKIVSYIWTLLS